jgi:hypothetical protein
MASAQEQAVERKLRPVYDAIDCGNLKLALKSVTAVLQARREGRPTELHCSLAQHSPPFLTRRPFSHPTCACLQKHPESCIAGALRAVVLQRSGKDDDALAAAEEVAKRTPTDEHVLQTLGLVWRATGRTAVRHTVCGSSAA